ncbi:hypothetical protein Drorol1_Dr00018296 [Drosera rotundifolia]
MIRFLPLSIHFTAAAESPSAGNHPRHATPIEGFQNIQLRPILLRYLRTRLLYLLRETESNERGAGRKYKEVSKWDVDAVVIVNRGLFGCWRISWLQLLEVPLSRFEVSLKELETRLWGFGDGLFGSNSALLLVVASRLLDVKELGSVC